MGDCGIILKHVSYGYGYRDAAEQKGAGHMKQCLLGAIWGDVCGVPYEFHPETRAERINLNHPRRTFSDDTVLTLAVAKAILEKRPYAEVIGEFAQRYPNVGFGGMFRKLWIEEGRFNPYGSYGNGAAMRVAPVGWAFNTIPDVLREAEASAACSHDHPEAIKSAQAVALSIFLARKGQDKETIRETLEEMFGYTFPPFETLRAEALERGFDVTYASVPVALGVFFETESFEACLRETIALGADADTQACIACAVAEAYYGVDESLARSVQSVLPAPLLKVLNAFATKYGI